MATRASLSITRLMILEGLDQTVLLDLASSLLRALPDPFGSAELQLFASLALDRSLHQDILSVITERAMAVKNAKTSSEDKLTALVRFARLLLPISYVDAESLFKEAVEVADDINVEAANEIALFAPLSEHAVSSMDNEQRRAVAHPLATVVGDAAVRLASHNPFPWHEVARALTALDVSFAHAAAARWQDSGITDCDTLLPPILEKALPRSDLSLAKVSALLPLVDQVNGELLIGIIEKASRQQNGLDLKTLAEELAREELLRFGRGTRHQVTETLSSLFTKSPPGFWLDRLARATTFRQIERPGQAPPSGEEQWFHRRNEAGVEHPDPLDSIDWTAHRFVSAQEIDDVIGRATAAARASNTFVLTSTVLDRIRCIVALGDRAAHLDALSRSEYQKVPDYELAQAIAKAVGAWHGAPSIRHWCRERLMSVVVNRLPGFSRWLANGDSPLPAMLGNSGVPAHQICAALLEGMERHVDALSALTVHALVGLVGRYCTPGEAAQVIARYSTRLVQRIPTHERDNWDLTDIPTEAAGSIARFLYALMGDVDVRIRWRAAHALRRIARLGDVGTLDKLIDLYGRTSEPSYRKSDAPFYWLAARLWLVITLDRIAAETPSAVGRHGHWLLQIASDNDFPHILVRSFAKSAACKLLENGALTLNPTQRKTLKRVNTSPVPRRKGREPYRVGFDRYRNRECESRRFHFDTMDTLPYWYGGALRSFADLDGEEFLDAAERWIVDRWDVQSNPWRWDDEPRQYRFSDHSLLSMHSHGSLPTMERFRTYLEWHAMWCATGELMQTRALAKVGEDDYDTFEHWLSREGLTAPPLWLADLRGMKPLEVRLWFAPQENVDAWVEDVDDDDFLAELGLISEDGTIVFGGNHDTRSWTFMLSAKVQMALVSPDTASALVRALQTVDSWWDYRIPPAGDDFEIDVPPYKLVGWLVDGEHELGIDERNPLRYEVRAIERRPSHKTAMALNIEFVHDAQPRWDEASRRNTVFVYEPWGDNHGDERDERLRYDETVRSSGWRLRMDKAALRTFLNEMGFGLIVEIEITRRNKGYEYARHDEEAAKEARFDRVLLLRRDGIIEAAEGHLGAWTIPGA